MDSIKSRLKLTGGANGRLRFYCILFIVQIPFLFSDILIAFTSTDQDYMDTSYKCTVYFVFPWLMAMGFSEATFMFILLVGCILRVTQCIRFDTLKKIQLLVFYLMLVKILLCCYMQLKIFFALINPLWSGGSFVYGIVLIIIHSILLFSITLLASFCKT